MLDYKFLPDADKYHSVYSLYEQTTHHRLNRDLEIHFIELAKWREARSKVKNRLDKWAIYLSNIGIEDITQTSLLKVLIP